MSKSIDKEKLLLTMRDILVAIIIVIIAMQFVRPTIVFGSSMEETLSDKDYIILSKQAYLAHEIERGDVIVFDAGIRGNDGIEKNYIKRVIGIPDDIVSISNGKVYVNDEIIIEPYLNGGDTPGEVTSITIPDDYYFVLGDNRYDSEDSRSAKVGLVNREDIFGKAILRAFPISNFGTIE